MCMCFHVYVRVFSVVGFFIIFFCERVSIIEVPMSTESPYLRPVAKTTDLRSS